MIVTTPESGLSGYGGPAETFIPIITIVFPIVTRAEASAFLIISFSILISLNSSIYLNFVLLYFEQVKKIPQFYYQNEWVESKSEIYHSLRKKIKNYYESKGLPKSGFPIFLNKYILLYK